MIDGNDNYLITYRTAGRSVGKSCRYWGRADYCTSTPFLGTYTLIIPEISPQLAVGTSMVVVLATGLSSTLAYMKQKKVDYKSGLYFLWAAALGQFLGRM